MLRIGCLAGDARERFTSKLWGRRFLSPLFDEEPGFPEGTDNLAIEERSPEPGIEVRDITVLAESAGLDKQRCDVDLQAWRADTLDCIADYKITRSGDLLPSRYAPA